MELETRQKICQLVAGLIIADDLLDAKEEAFIDRVIKGFGIDDPRREVILPLVDSSEAAEQIKELPADARAEAFRLLIEAACVDGEVADEERAWLQTIATALEVSHEELEKRLAAQLKG